LGCDSVSSQLAHRTKPPPFTRKTIALLYCGKIIACRLYSYSAKVVVVHWFFSVVVLLVLLGIVFCILEVVIVGLLSNYYLFSFTHFYGDIPKVKGSARM